MGLGFPSDREMRQLREAADLQRQMDEAMRPVELVYPQDLLYDFQDALEQYHRTVKDLQQGDFLRRLQKDLQVAEHLRETFLANQLDLEEAAQEAFEQHERIQDALGYEGLEATIALAEQHFEASLDIDRMAQVTQQLDAEHFVRTLRRAQELHYDTAITDMLAQRADIEAIIREAEAAIGAMDASPAEPGEFAGEVSVGPPEWMRRLSPENRRALIHLLALYIDTFLACYGLGVALSDGKMTDADVQAVGHMLLTALYWALYLDNHREND